MMKKSYKLFYIISSGFFSILILFGCNLYEKHRFNCLPIDNFFTYPIDQWTNKPTPTLVSPDINSWVIQSEDPNLGNPPQMITRGKDQIWMLGSKLQLYTKSNQQLKQYFIEWNGEKSIPSFLLLSNDGTLWAFGIQAEKTMPILSRYIDKDDKFEPVIDKQKILLMKGAVRGSFVEDSKKRIWMAIPGKGLFKFTYNTLLVEVINSDNLDSKIFNGNIVVDSNDDLWLGTHTNDWFNNLFFYDPKNNHTSVLSLGVNEQGVVNGLLIDKEERLWIGDYAYWNIGTPLPTEGQMGLNLIIRSQAFITNHMPFHDYLWLRPEVLFEDSDGNIWYSGYGLTRLNPKTGEWCKIFDDISNIAEDNQGIFWVVSKGKLYSHN
jgi:hypothetical protein